MYERLKNRNGIVLTLFLLFINALFAQNKNNRIVLFLSSLILVFITISPAYSQINIAERKELDNKKYNLVYKEESNNPFVFYYVLVDENEEAVGKEDLDIGYYFLVIEDGIEASFSFKENEEIDGQIQIKNSRGQTLNIYHLKDGYLTKMLDFELNGKERREYYYKTNFIESFWYREEELYKKVISKNPHNNRKAFEYNETYNLQDELIFKEDRVDKVYIYYKKGKKRLEINLKQKKLQVYDEKGVIMQGFEDFENTVFEVEELNEERLILVLNKGEENHYYLFESGVFKQKDIVNLRKGSIQIFNPNGKLKKKGDILEIDSGIMGTDYFMEASEELQEDQDIIIELSVEEDAVIEEIIEAE